METWLKNIEKYFENNFTKQWLLKYFEIENKWIIKNIFENTNKRTFNSLFFNLFFDLIKKKNFLKFRESELFLANNFDKLMLLLNNYHYEMIFTNDNDSKTIFRNEIYDILEYNLSFVKDNYEVKDDNWFTKLYELNLFSINNWLNKEDINLEIRYYDNNLDVQDYQNWFVLAVTTWEKVIYTLWFYLWKNEILVSNIQWHKDSKDYSMVRSYSKILIYLLILIWKKINIDNLLLFTNKNHPCKNHNINKGFKGDYDNIWKNIWLKTNDNYFKWKLSDIKQNNINNIIKWNIDFEVKKIYNALWL